MNVMFIASDNSNHSGAFLSMVRLAGLLKDVYHHKILVVLPMEGDGKALLDAEGIENVLIPSYSWTIPMDEQGKLIRRAKSAVKSALTSRHVDKLARLMREREIDIVHINTSWTYIGALAAIKAGIPFIWHIREFLEEDQSMCIQNREKGYALMRRADRVVAISDSIYQKYAPILGEDKMLVIRNGIDPDRYRNDDHEILKDDTAQFLMVGGVCEGKGQRKAIQAFAVLHEKEKADWHLRLVGIGSDEYIAELREMARASGIEEYVEFCGPQSDTPAYYGSSDIFLMCSKAEAFGRVTVEAMMGGCLVIGNRTAGTKELIEDGVTGLLYEDGNVEELADKISYAIHHPAKAREMASKGRTYMNDNMTAQLNAEKVNNLYQKIIGGGETCTEIITLCFMCVTFRKRRACA